ncbi:MAG: BlaI/MecI/CopY family transcriptional regulator [Cellvibrionaceae bacterium]
MRPKKKDNTLLTDVELEFMKILWALGEGKVRDVMAAFPSTRKLAYTSASTILRILEQKEFVQSRKEGISHIYSPLVAKAVYENTSLNHLVKHVFEDAPLAMVTRLVDDERMPEDQLLKLKELIETRLSE